MYHAYSNEGGNFFGFANVDFETKTSNFIENPIDKFTDAISVVSICNMVYVIATEANTDHHEYEAMKSNPDTLHVYIFKNRSLVNSQSVQVAPFKANVNLHFFEKDFRAISAYFPK